ncbi:hypothetical protein CDL12_03611 [Handroanthus impetiginosus]|uniref:Dof-type domain-containing protein n=1 Tax=Handroanthus impetiginosus TaxID=429701 RepID=A0A2G9I1L9_9LAMI|nr:hypothetical protein CDL12_03611 [Handroanthus impetiginosus]
MKSSSPRLVSGDSTDVGGLKLFQGISPAMDFQLQGINFPQNTALLNHFPSFGEISNAISSNFPGNMNHSHGFQEMGSSNLPSTLANSIESLSSINQDLHLKLQQQRLSMLLANNHKENSTNLHFVEKPEPILFQNLDISKTTESCGIAKKDGNLSTEWFFDNSYANGNPNPETGGSNENENNSNWSGAQAWSDVAQFTSLP